MIIYYFSSQEEIGLSQKDILIHLNEMFAFLAHLHVYVSGFEFYVFKKSLFCVSKFWTPEM